MVQCPPRGCRLDRSAVAMLRAADATAPCNRSADDGAAPANRPSEARRERPSATSSIVCATFARLCEAAARGGSYGRRSQRSALSNVFTASDRRYLTAMNARYKATRVWCCHLRRPRARAPRCATHQPAMRASAKPIETATVPPRGSASARVTVFGPRPPMLSSKTARPPGVGQGARRRAAVLGTGVAGTAVCPAGASARHPNAGRGRAASHAGRARGGLSRRRPDCLRGAGPPDPAAGAARLMVWCDASGRKQQSGACAQNRDRKRAAAASYVQGSSNGLRLPAWQWVKALQQSREAAVWGSGRACRGGAWGAGARRRPDASSAARAV